MEAVTYLNVPDTMWGGPTVRSTVSISRLTVDHNRFTVAGTVSYGGTSYPFELSGEFYASRLGKPVDKVATAQDLSGNFSVLHLALRYNPDPAARLVNTTARGPMLFLYLQRTGTREVTLLETELTGKSRSSELANLLKVHLNRGQFGSDYWQPKLFKPFSGPTSSVGMAAVQDNDIQSYSEGRYMTGPPNSGCWLEYWIRFQAYANGPSDIYRGASDFNHKLEVLRKWTASNCAFYVSEDSPYVLGKYADPVKVKIKAYGDGSTKGDVLLKGWYNGYFKPKSVLDSNVSISLGLGYMVASVSWSLTLCCTQPVKPDEVYVFSQQDPNQWTKLAQYSYTDRYLPDVGMYFQAIVQNAYGTGARSQRYIQAQWTVPIYADYDDLSTTLYYKTTRYPSTILYYYGG